MATGCSSRKTHLHCVQALDARWGGGLAAAALGLHYELQRRGESSIVLSTRGRRADAKAQGVYSFRRTGLTRMFLSIPMWRAAPPIVSSADFVHMHGLYAATNWVVGRTARTQHASLVVHPHGMFEPYILKRSRVKKKIAHWLFEDANIAAARLWRALTTIEADQIRALVPSAAVVVVPNGVQLPARTATHQNTRRIGYLGRIHEKKGLPLLLEAWSHLANTFPDWELAIVGPGNADQVAAIRRVAQGLPRVTVQGPLTGLAKEQFLASLNLFVLPSLSEGFPMAVLEAMAAAVPVVVTRTSNAPPVDVVGAGWTCEPDAGSVRRALATALNAGVGELRARGAVARDLVARDYSWESVTTVLLDACQAS